MTVDQTVMKWECCAVWFAICIGRFKARLNWRWLSKARDSYGFMSCVAQMLILCRYTKCMDFTGDFYAACSGLFVHDGSAPRSWL